MALPTISGVGRLIDDPDLRFTPSGVAVCTVRIAFNSRKKDDAGNWVDADVCYLTGTVFRDEAERVVESLSKGTEVTITGKIRTRSYDDKDGNKRSATDLVIDSIGPTLKYASVTVRKLARKSQQAEGPGYDNPWETADDTRAFGQPADDDQPPF